MPRTILFTWELGGGIGHMMQVLPLARALRRRGHRVVVALRDLGRAHAIFGAHGMELLQAPVKLGPPRSPAQPPYTFAHVLHNVGYERADELAGLAGGWRTLLEAIRPDVAVFDHSPTAMLASRGLPAARVAIGLGFCCVPDRHPLPNLRHWERGVDLARLKCDEDRVLGRMNEVLAGNWAQPPLERIGQLYSDVDDTFLLTFRELDHFTDRAVNPATRYRGTWVRPEGKPPDWPNAGNSKKRIYAYLKDFPALRPLLAHLKRLGHPTLIFIDGIDAATQREFASPTLRFETERLDVVAVARECDLAILNANHGTACALLLAGKPILQLPIYLEQGLFAERVTRMGAGLQANVNKADEVIATLTRMLAAPEPFAKSAAAFGARHRDFDPQREHEEMVGRIEELASRR